MTATIRLVRLPEGEQSGVPDAFFDGLEGLSRMRSLATLGTEDLTTSAPEFRAAVSDADRRRVRVLAIADRRGKGIDEWLRGSRPDRGVPAWEPADPADDGVGPADVVGALAVGAPLTSDLHEAEIDVMAAGAWAGSGLARLLLDIGEAVASSWGRPVRQVWTQCPQWAETGSPQAVAGMATPIPGARDVASPRRTPMTDLLRDAGFRPVHAEWVTCLDVVEALAGRAEAIPGYEVLSWSGPRSPEQLLGQLAAIYALASTDMPSGEMTIEPGHWDEDRVTRKEALAQRCGQEWVVTAVRPIGGELVGWTTLMVPPGLPEVVYQEGTLVRADHRRRGLAAWMKRVNLIELRARFPRARRVYTWTAGDNAPVIAMNARLGFRPAFIEVAWERTASGRTGEASP